jgi:hypothetical protein
MKQNKNFIYILVFSIVFFIGILFLIGINFVVNNNVLLVIKNLFFVMGIVGCVLFFILTFQLFLRKSL